jgi:hypothetical protein
LLLWFWSIGLTSGCGDPYRSRLSHRTVPHPTDPAAAHLRIAAIAERTGFFDPSAFARVFRREFGYTPSEARAAAASGVSLPTAGQAAGHGAPGQVGEDFGALLRRLGATAPPRVTAA